MEPVLQTWLALQCELIPGAAEGVLLLAGPEVRAPAPAARWPAGSAGASELAAVAELALAEKRVVVNGQPAQANGATGARHVAVPLGTAHGVAGAVAIALEPAAPATSRAVVDLLRSGTAWLDLLRRGEAGRERLRTVLGLLGSVLEHERFRAAGTALVTELATRFEFERVCLGFEHRGQMRVEALSHSARFDARAKLIRDLGLAMDEASDQDATILHPAPPEATPRITRAHEELANAQGGAAVCTVPIARNGRVVGALTVERPTGRSLDPEAISLCEEVATLAGPILALKRDADARPLERVREFLRQQLAKLLGPDHLPVKAGAVALALALLFLGVARGTYRVTAEATLEGRVQRAIVAGTEGYIAEANARAGDLVRRGQVLGRLDERDLRLERQKWAARREQYRREAREALAAHDRSQVNILNAKSAQADAELELLDEQLARTRLVAPFDGVVVRGDLSQSLGSPVEKGEVLFEVAPLDGYRIIVKVDERDIADVSAGKQGHLVLSSLPGRSVPLTVERLTPISIAEDGRNHFRVDARLEEPVDSLRPGMEGVAKIAIDRRRLAWIWTHGLVDWLRLWTWSWWP